MSLAKQGVLNGRLKCLALLTALKANHLRWVPHHPNAIPFGECQPIQEMDPSRAGLEVFNLLLLLQQR